MSHPHQGFTLSLGPSEPGHVTFNAVGFLSLGDAAPLLRSAIIDEQIVSGKAITLDLSGLVSYDPAGLAALKDLYRRAAARSARVTSTNVPDLACGFRMSIVFIEAMDFAYRA
jgi:ABC-type transporter Mla MlaB component